VEDTLLIAALRDADGDPASVRRGEEPVDRVRLAGVERPGIDEDSPVIARPLLYPQDEAVRGIADELEPPSTRPLWREDEGVASAGGGRLLQLLEPLPAPKLPLGEGVLGLLPSKRLG
jgi:hypothetical protein